MDDIETREFRVGYADPADLRRIFAAHARLHVIETVRGLFRRHFFKVTGPRCVVQAAAEQIRAAEFEAWGDAQF